MNRIHRRESAKKLPFTILTGLFFSIVSSFAQEVEKIGNDVSSQPSPPKSNGTNQPASLPVSIATGVSEQFKSDIDNVRGGLSGSFSVARYKIGIGLPIRLADDFQLGTTLRYGYDDYDFNRQGVNPRPWSEVNTLSATSILYWRLNETWSVYGGGFLKMSAESDVALNEGTTGGGLAGFDYKMRDDLSFGLGIAAASRIKDDGAAMPLVTVKWKIADHWLFNAGLTDIAAFGYGAEIKWLCTEKVDFGLGAQVHQSRFRVKGHAAYVGSGSILNRSTVNGVGQESGSIIYLDGTWHACSKFDLNAFTGFTAGGQLREDDSNGNKISEADYSTAAVIGLRAILHF
jgi:hypothetical protein